MNPLSTQKNETLDIVLNGLMSRYKERVPDVKTIINAMTRAGIIETMEGIENDHIAFRTMGVPQLGIQSFEKIFLHYGYEKKSIIFLKVKSWMPGGTARHVKPIRGFL